MSSKPRTARITRNQPSSPERANGRQSRPRAYRSAWAPVDLTQSTNPPVYQQLSDAPPALIERAVEKYGFIQRFVVEGFPRGKLEAYARLHAEARGLGETDVPRYTTLNGWAHRYHLFGMLGLVDQPRRDAGVSRTVTGAALTAAELGVALGNGPTGVLALMSDLVDGDLPKVDSVRRVLRRLERENPLLAAMAKGGPTAFRDLTELTTTFLAVLGGVRVSIDSTVLDRWIKVPNGDGGWEAMRPVLTVIEDVGSRLLVTFNLSLYPIDSGICAAVLGRAIDARQNYPGLMSVGVPYEIALDKGSEHQGQFCDVLNRLQIEVVPRNNDSPRGGAHVERLIGTITTEVCANRLGFSKAERIIDPYAPSDRDTKRNLAQLKYEPYRLDIPVGALVTLSDLEAEILGWATLYNARPHPALEVNSPEIQGLLRSARFAAQRRGSHTVSSDADDRANCSDSSEVA